MTTDIAKMTAAERKVYNATVNYWNSRKGAAYYYYVASFVSAFGRDANSIIDIGSYKTGIVEWFDWIPERYALDIDQPYSSENVKGIKADFLTYRPDKKFDIAICSQVMEHVVDVETFAAKLFEIADNVIITVPYKWPVGHTKSHVQDPVDEVKLRSWTKRDPQHWLIVPEPLIRNEVAYRLIAYYDSNPAKFELSRVRTRARPVPQDALPQIARSASETTPRTVSNQLRRFRNLAARVFKAARIS